ncbi:MAG: hypothetical protein L0K82_00895 [Pisciglobus halotolerans]|nr:hypothetical protein [Pisciglobus halotolerans]
MDNEVTEMTCDLKTGICKPASKGKDSKSTTDLVQEITVNSLKLKFQSNQEKEKQ